MSSLRRMIKKTLIHFGLYDPGSKGRHAWVGNIELSDMKRQFQISFLKDFGLLPEHRLLDLGCGTLRGGIPIIQYLNAGNYCGIDVQAKALAEARKELSENNLDNKSVLLLDAKSAATQLENTRFDYIWAFSVLIHIDDDKLDDTMRFASEHLAGNGVFYGNVNIGEREDGEWLGFPVVTRPLSLYEDTASQNGLKLDVVGTLHSLGHISGKQKQDQQMMLRFTHL